MEISRKSMARGVAIAFLSIGTLPSMAERVLNIQRWTTRDHGGHFAALEQPEALTADVRAFFRQFRR